MATASDPVPTRAIDAGAVRGRAQGIVLGSLMAFGWAWFAAATLPASLRIAALTVAALVTVALLAGSVALMRRARALPVATQAGGGRAWLWFVLNFVVEVVLLNVAITLLAAPDLHIYWIPAISAVVGLHFLPMAVFFRARSYWWVGGAMIAVAAVAAVAIVRDTAAAAAIVRGEAAVNALILWSALAAGVVQTRG